jgi:biotin carboxyl carrier protein
MATRLDLEDAAREERSNSAASSPTDPLRNWEVDELGRIHSLPSPSQGREPVNVEEELLAAQQQDEDERAQALEQQNQQDRLEAQAAAEQEQQNSPANQLKQAGTDLAKKYVKDLAKEEAAAAIASTAPIWGTVLAILAAIALIVGLGIFVIISVASTCNAGGLTGFGAKTASFIGSFMPATGGVDICDSLTIATNVQTATQNAPNPNNPTTGDLVHLVGYGIPVKAGVDDRVTACMAGRLTAIFAIARTAQPPIDIEITDAYRPGGTTAGGGVSAHSRGEAADISLRNPKVPVHGNDPRISDLIAIAQSVGFVPPQGDTLDEYHNPAPNASAGHVHVEFNIPKNGGSYCSGTAS